MHNAETERVRVRRVRRTQYGKASEGARTPCVAKVEILSIPDGAHIVGKWVGRVGGGRSAERTSQSGVPISGRNIETDRTCIQDAEAAMRSIVLPGSCLWSDSFVFSGKQAACLPVLVGGGKAEKVWRVGSRGGCEKVRKECKRAVT